MRSELKRLLYNAKCKCLLSSQSCNKSYLDSLEEVAPEVSLEVANTRQSNGLWRGPLWSSHRPSYLRIAHCIYVMFVRLSRPRSQQTFKVTSSFLQTSVTANAAKLDLERLGQARRASAMTCIARRRPFYRLGSIGPEQLLGPSNF